MKPVAADVVAPVADSAVKPATTLVAGAAAPSVAAVANAAKPAAAPVVAVARSAVEPIAQAATPALEPVAEAAEPVVTSVGEAAEPAAQARRRGGRARRQAGRRSREARARARRRSHEPVTEPVADVVSRSRTSSPVPRTTTSPPAALAAKTKSEAKPSAENSRDGDEPAMSRLASDRRSRARAVSAAPRRASSTPCTPPDHARRGITPLLRSLPQANYRRRAHGRAHRAATDPLGGVRRRHRDARALHGRGGRPDPAVRRLPAAMGLPDLHAHAGLRRLRARAAGHDPRRGRAVRPRRTAAGARSRRSRSRPSPSCCS